MSFIKLSYNLIFKNSIYKYYEHWLYTRYYAWYDGDTKIEVRASVLDKDSFRKNKAS